MSPKTGSFPGKTVSTRKRAPPLKIFFYEFDENDSATCIFALLCATTYLGLLELRFRGGELCRGRGDGEHDSILYRVCVYEEISITQTFFFSFV